MRNFFFAITFLLNSAIIFAQNFSAEVIYESKGLTKVSAFIANGVPMSDQKQKEIQDKINKMNEKTFTLVLNQFESIYEEQQKLSSSTSGAQNLNSYDKEGNYYKNLKTKTFKKAEESFNKNYIISDSLKNFNWKLKPETKKIGNYICNKAISIQKVTKEELKNYEIEKAEKEKNKTNFFKLEIPKDKITVAWYTMTIPVGQGPDKFWGLPGLILEVNDNNKIILCSKITINPKTPKSIKLPKNGKIISQKAFDKMEEEGYSKMFEGQENPAFEIKN